MYIHVHTVYMYLYMDMYIWCIPASSPPSLPPSCPLTCSMNTTAMPLRSTLFFSCGRSFSRWKASISCTLLKMMCSFPFSEFGSTSETNRGRHFWGQWRIMISEIYYSVYTYTLYIHVYMYVPICVYTCIIICIPVIYYSICLCRL